jgi:hypothetical protein
VHGWRRGESAPLATSDGLHAYVADAEIITAYFMPGSRVKLPQVMAGEAVGELFPVKAFGLVTE